MGAPSHAAQEVVIVEGAVFFLRGDPGHLIVPQHNSRPLERRLLAVDLDADIDIEGDPPQFALMYAEDIRVSVNAFLDDIEEADIVFLRTGSVVTIFPCFFRLASESWRVSLANVRKAS